MAFIKTISLPVFFGLALLGFNPESKIKNQISIFGKWQCISIKPVKKKSYKKMGNNELKLLKEDLGNMSFEFRPDSTFSTFIHDELGNTGRFISEKGKILLLLLDKYKDEENRNSKIIQFNQKTLELKDPYLEVIIKMKRIK